MFFGSTLTSAKSLPRPQTRCSLLTRCQVSPASSERIDAAQPRRIDERVEALRIAARDTAKPMRPRPCRVVGSPCVSCFQVVPPSVDLKSPLSGPCQAPFSHGPCRAAHRTA